jgi:hypothetical protein
MQSCSLGEFDDYPARRQSDLSSFNFLSLLSEFFQSSDAGLWCFMGVFFKGKPRGWEYLHKINNNNGRYLQRS